MITPVMAGRLDVIERVAREFVEDCARNGVAYCEARYSPTLLMKDGITGDQVIANRWKCTRVSNTRPGRLLIFWEFLI